MATSSLRDYLVTLGFKVDEKSLTKFTNSVNATAKSVTKLAAVIGGTTLAIGAGITAFAANLEDFYFAAKKSGASVTNLKALEEAAQNFGVASGEATDTVKALARFLREKDPTGGFLKGMGADSRDANDRMLDTVATLMNLGKVVRGMSYKEGQAYFQDLIGGSEDMYRAVREGGFIKELQKQKGIIGAAGFDKASKDAHKFMKDLRLIQTYLEVFAAQVQKAIVERMGISLKQVGEWLKKNGPEMAIRIVDLIEIFWKFAKVVGNAVLWVVEKLMALDKATDGVSTKAIILVAAFTALGGPAIIAALGGLAAAITTLSPLMALLVGWNIGTWINTNFSDANKDRIGWFVYKMVQLADALVAITNTTLDGLFGPWIRLLFPSVGANTPEEKTANDLEFGNRLRSLIGSPEDWFTSTAAQGIMMQHARNPAASIGSGGSSTNTQNITIHITGGDPIATANAVSGALQNPTRNLLAGHS